MQLRPANNASFEELIAYYKSRSISELRAIIPKWAFGANASNVSDVTIGGNQKEYIICLTNIRSLKNRTSFLEVSTDVLFTGVLLNDGRVARILHRWDHQEFVDPPTIGILDHKSGLLGFSDGRHRTKVAYLLECTEIPIAFHRLDYAAINSIIPLKSL